MSTVVACMVCARPFDSLLTGGLHAGVLVMAVVAVAVLGGIARGALRLLREDAVHVAEANGAMQDPGARP